uniref:Uncharacterized protein n=1 Tax=Phlebotomus papatasi TaxID=29031 RepID=A0A1B0D1G0_PHLPP
MEKKVVKGSGPRFTTTTRNDRVAQMSKQEEIIAKKKRELIEKQRTAELAKAIAAATNEGNTATSTSATPATPRNSFNNDGSFLENFKKITQAANVTTAVSDTMGTNESLETQSDSNRKNSTNSEDSMAFEGEELCENMHKDSVYKSEYALMQSQAVTQERREMTQKHPVTTPNIQSHSFSMQVPPPVPPSFPPKPPQTSPSTTKPSSPFYNPNIPPPRVMLSTPPPGPVAPPAYPPPLLHTIPPPAPLVLNEIPAPKALDLNAIPKPTLNLDAIKVPEFATAPPPPPPTHFPKVFSDNEIIPTTIDTLVVMVAENGDAYEDKIRSRKNDVHSSLW